MKLSVKVAKQTHNKVASLEAQIADLRKQKLELKHHIELREKSEKKLEEKITFQQEANCRLQQAVSREAESILCRREGVTALFELLE